MSSYLTFYGIKKEKKMENQEKSGDTTDVKEEYIDIVSFSRNDDLYRYFDENMNIAFCYEGVSYTPITTRDVDKVIDDIKNDISHSEKRLFEYEKHAGENTDLIHEILSVKEYLEDLYRVLHYTEFVGHIVYDASLEYGSGFSGIVANIS